MSDSDPFDHPERVVRLLAKIVSIPSVNTDPAESDTRNPEAAMVEFLADHLAGLGCEIERREVRAGRVNLFARMAGADRSKTLVLQAHMDTVGVEGMTIEPHAPTIDGARLTGRGSCDTKGSLAAFVEAMQRVAESDEAPPWDVVFLGMMGEETGCEGSQALADEGFRADAALIGEATFCKPMITHKGSVWWKLSTEGVTAHGSTPHLGVSAFYRMRHVLKALEEDVPKRLAEITHPMLGSPSINCGMISGGEKPNVVPARCTLEMDGRVLPDMDAHAYPDQVAGWIRDAIGDAAGPITISGANAFKAFQIEAEHPLVRTCLAASREILGDAAEPIGGAFFSDAGPLADAGTPCVVFGPGDIGKAHSPDEYLEIDELIQCAKITERIIRTIGG